MAPGPRCGRTRRLPATSTLAGPKWCVRTVNIIFYIHIAVHECIWADGGNCDVWWLELFLAAQPALLLLTLPCRGLGFILLLYILVCMCRNNLFFYPLSPCSATTLIARASYRKFPWCRSATATSSGPWRSKYSTLIRAASTCSWARWRPAPGNWKSSQSLCRKIHWTCLPLFVGRKWCWQTPCSLH